MAKRGEFPSLSAYDQGALPEMVPSVKPEVNLTSTSSNSKKKVRANKTQSAVELLSQSRVGRVISVSPVETKIWVQVGAFHAKASAVGIVIY